MTRKTIRRALIALLIVSIILPLLLLLAYTRTAQLKAESDAREISIAVAQLLNGGYVMAGNNIVSCRVEKPVQLVNWSKP